MLPHIRLILYYLLRLRANRACNQAAALVKVTENIGFNLRFLAINGGRAHETAAANILCQDFTTSQADNTKLVLTYPPTEWCLGLLWARFVPEVWYLDAANNIQMIKRPKENPDATGYVRTLQGPLLPLPPDGAPADQVRHWYLQAVIAANPKTTKGAAMLDTFTQQFHAAAVLTADPFAAVHTPFLECIPAPVANCNSAILRDGIFMKVAFALVGLSWTVKGLTSRGNGLQGGNNIGAVLVDSSCRILAWSVNVAQENTTLHAECSLIRTLLNQGRALPAACTLYTTLEPCHMCASLIATCCDSWKVFYGQKDPAIENNALLRCGQAVPAIEAGCRGSSRQQQLLERAAGVVEEQWKLYRAQAEKRQNTLDFLRDDASRRAFNSLQLLPDIIERNFRAMGAAADPRTIPINAGSDHVAGALDLALPGVPRRTPRLPLASNTTAGRLNLDTSANPVRPAPVPTHQTSGFAQEIALTTQCVQLIANLRARGYIKLPE